LPIITIEETLEERKRKERKKISDKNLEAWK